MKRVGNESEVVEDRFVAFQGSGNKLGGNNSTNNNNANIGNSYEDDLAIAIRLSMSEHVPIETEAEKKKKLRELRLAALEKRGL